MKRARFRLVWKGDYEDGCAVGIIVTTLVHVLFDLMGWGVV